MQGTKERSEVETNKDVKIIVNLKEVDDDCRQCRFWKNYGLLEDWCEIFCCTLELKGKELRRCKACFEAEVEAGAKELST